MSAIVCIDPGQYTGVAIFDFEIPTYLAETGTIRDNGKLTDYAAKLEAMKIKHEVVIAVIEQYQNFGRRFYNAGKVNEQIRACKDVFDKHILVKTSQWNPRHYQDQFKRRLAASAFQRDFTNSHCTDAALMGQWFGQWLMAWSRQCQVSPAEMAVIIAEEFGHIPERGKLQVWADEFVRDKKPIFTLNAEFGDYGRTERKIECNSTK